MSSFNYMNNTAPFWDIRDFLVSAEQQGNNHPFFGQNRQERNGQNEYSQGHVDQHPHSFNSWPFGQPLFGGPGGLPHRGPPPPAAGPHGPTPGPNGPQPHHDERSSHHEHDGEKDGDKSDNDNDSGEGPAGSGSDGEEGHRCGRGRHGRCGGRRGRHGFGGRGGYGPHHGGSHHRGPAEGPHGGPYVYGQGHGPRGHHHPGGPGGRAWHGWTPPFFAPRSFSGEADFSPASNWGPFFDAFVFQHPSNKNNKDAAKDNEDFSPEADIFDTPSAYVIHVSLPGARKEDVGVNWDADKSELSVAGVIYRPGDEDFLKALAMDERKVGPFERKIRLGTRANPARVDAECITAKLEDGVLRIEVRKEEEGFVEIRKVDVQ